MLLITKIIIEVCMNNPAHPELNVSPADYPPLFAVY